MDIPFSIWAVTIIGIAAVIAFDFVLVARRPHEPSVRECVYWVIFYVSLAMLFGLFVVFKWGGHYGAQFYAGWLTEYSLSVDNLFIFLIIMSRFAVPRRYQQEVLLIGIILALLMRGVFIAAGAAAINRFHGVFYLFGAFLIYTAITLMRHDEAKDFQENRVLRTVRRVLPTTHGYYGSKVTVKIDGKRLFTPMLIVMVAIGTTDLLFALDSIPAIFGLTQEPYLVFAANAFALMGLRQLYFLIGGLLDRLVYLSHGLAVVLGFIGVKLILEAAHKDGVSWAPEIPIWVSLGVIVGTLAVTAILSLRASREDGARPRQPVVVEVDETLVDPTHPELLETATESQPPGPPPTGPQQGQG
ncbi:MAG: TerC family protein [Sporichthyaceae bacterium]|nr:TerC family protein [Sporichthyaceae bacterium]